jgi:hypothetical protein
LQISRLLIFQKPSHTEFWQTIRSKRYNFREWISRNQWLYSYFKFLKVVTRENGAVLGFKARRKREKKD